MSKLECTIRHYELKGTENYCPICGLKLKERTAQEIPVQEQLVNLSELKVARVLLFK